jgi:putative oxidoreductase
MNYQRMYYWIATGVFAAWMLANAVAYLTTEQARVLCRHFGFPGYFRVELAVMKLLGTMVLVFPFIKGRWKEWAYAGFTITVVSGFIAHVCSGDSLPASCSALVALLLLLVSYGTYSNIKTSKHESSRSVSKG